MLACLCPMSCSTLHHFLCSSACFHATCLAMFEVPTLAIHVCLVVPDASASRAHIVQVCLKFPFRSATPHHLWDHFRIYSSYSNSRSNSVMSSFVWPLPKENVLDVEVVKCFQDDSIICKRCYVVGSLHSHYPWLLLRSTQLTGAGTQLVLTASPLHPPPLKMVVTLGSSSKTHYAQLFIFTHLLQLNPQSLCKPSNPLNQVGSCCWTSLENQVCFSKPMPTSLDIPQWCLCQIIPTPAHTLQLSLNRATVVPTLCNYHFQCQHTLPLQRNLHQGLKHPMLHPHGLLLLHPLANSVILLCNAGSHVLD